MAVETEDLGPTRRRAQEVERRADRGRLPRAVRSEEAEDLAAPDLEIDALDPADAAVCLREAIGPDDGRRRACRHTLPTLCAMRSPSRIPAGFIPGSCRGATLGPFIRQR